jgi:peptidyl-prolyl cis-trans isomerase D
MIMSGIINPKTRFNHEQLFRDSGCEIAISRQPVLDHFTEELMSINQEVKKSLEKHNLTAKSLTAYLLFGAIVLVFVLFNFPNQKLGAGRQGIAAQVGNQLISLADFKEESQRLEKMYNQFLGGGIDASSQRSFLRGRALENLISFELLYQKAQNEGVYSPDSEVRDFLTQDIPAFQDNGQFDRSRYYQYLEAMNMTPEDFEVKVRKDRVSQRLRRVFEYSGTPLLKEEELLKEIDGTKFNVVFAKIDLESLRKQIQVNDADVKEFMATPDAAKKIENEYSLHVNDTYSEKEQVNAQHILIKSKTGDVEQEKNALAKINIIKERAQKEDFAVLAKGNSEDEGSKSKGGELGFFAKGQMVPQFEEAAFKAAKGEIVGPVKTSFGYHLIKVLDKKEAKTKKLEEATSEIAHKLIAEQKVELFLKNIEELLKAKKIAEIDQELKAKNINKEETGFFSMGEEQVPKLGASEAIREIVFSLKTPGEWSPQLVREANLRYLVQLKESKKDVAQLSDEKVPNRTQQFLDLWVEQSKKQTKIYRNQDVIGM